MFLHCLSFRFTSGAVVPEVSWKSSVPRGSLCPRVSDGAGITGHPLRSGGAGSAHPTRGQGPPQVSRQLSDLICVNGRGRQREGVSCSAVWVRHLLLNGSGRGSDPHHRSWSHTALWCAVHLSVYPETQTVTTLQLSLSTVSKRITMYWRANTHRYAVLPCNPRQSLFSLEAHWSGFSRDPPGPQLSLWPRHALRAQLATLSWLRTIKQWKWSRTTCMQHFTFAGMKLSFY